jgi:hypothetical protein
MAYRTLIEAGRIALPEAGRIALPCDLVFVPLKIMARHSPWTLGDGGILDWKDSW